MNRNPQRRLAVGCAIAICLGLAGLLGIIMIPWPKPSLEELLSKRILGPVPEGMRNIQKIYYFNPSLGDGSFIAQFDADDQARNQLLQRWSWAETDHPGTILRSHTNVIDPSGRFYEYDETNRLLHLELHFFSKGNGGIIAGDF